MKYFTITSNSVRKRSVLYDHDTTESRDRAESFWLGGGGGRDKKMTKMLFLFCFYKKREGAKGSPAPPSAWSLERQ